MAKKNPLKKPTHMTILVLPDGSVSPEQTAAFEKMNVQWIGHRKDATFHITFLSQCPFSNWQGQLSRPSKNGIVRGKVSSRTPKAPPPDYSYSTGAARDGVLINPRLIVEGGGGLQRNGKNKTAKKR